MINKERRIKVLEGIPVTQQVADFLADKWTARAPVGVTIGVETVPGMIGAEALVLIAGVTVEDSLHAENLAEMHLLLEEHKVREVYTKILTTPKNPSKKVIYI